MVQKKKRKKEKKWKAQLENEKEAFAEQSYTSLETSVSRSQISVNSERRSLGFLLP